MPFFYTHTLYAFFTHSSKATVKGLLNLHSDSVMFLPFIASPESKLAKTSKGWTNHQKANWTKLSEEVWIEKTPRGDLEKPPEANWLPNSLVGLMKLRTGIGDGRSLYHFFWVAIGTDVLVVQPGY